MTSDTSLREVALLLNALVCCDRCWLSWQWRQLKMTSVFLWLPQVVCCPCSSTGEGSAQLRGLQTVWRCWLACLKQTRLCEAVRVLNCCGQICLSWARNHSYTVHSNTAEKLQAMTSGLWYQLSCLVQTKWYQYKDTYAVLEVRILSGLIAERESNVL